MTKSLASSFFKKNSISKQSLIVTLVLLPALLPTLLKSVPGCMDNSRHLTQLNDSKEYHFVRCSCPCNKRIAHQNRCIDCRHAHNPEPIEILDTAQAITPEQAKRYQQYEQYLESPEKTFNLRLQAMMQKRKADTAE